MQEEQTPIVDAAASPATPRPAAAGLGWLVAAWLLWMAVWNGVSIAWFASLRDPEIAFDDSVLLAMIFGVAVTALGVLLIAFRKKLGLVLACFGAALNVLMFFFLFQPNLDPWIHNRLISHTVGWLVNVVNVGILYGLLRTGAPSAWDRLWSAPAPGKDAEQPS